MATSFIPSPLFDRCMEHDDIPGGGRIIDSSPSLSYFVTQIRRHKPFNTDDQPKPGKEFRTREEKCDKCGKKKNLKLCSRCKEFYYCSIKCQREDYKDHKEWCLYMSSRNEFKKYKNGCNRCGNVENLKLCGGCKMISYCSRECQRLEYKEHKIICVEEQKEKLGDDEL